MIVDFRLETPSGQIIEPWRAQSEPGMRFVLSEGVSYYRLALPFEFMANRFDTGRHLECAAQDRTSQAAT